MVNLEIIGLTLEFIGTIMIGVAVILTHRKIRKEHRIDKRVIKELRLEQSVSIIGVILIIVGYIVNLNVLI